MRILANYGYKTNGDTYSVTFETIGDVSAAQAPQTVDELFRLAKEAVQRQVTGAVSGASHQPASQPTVVGIPQPVADRIERPLPPPRPVTHNGQGKKPQIKDPTLPASPKQIGLLKRLARLKGRQTENLTDLTMGEASTKIDELTAI